MDRTTVSRVRSVLLGAGFGALLMYVLDPQQGRRRLASARGRTVQLGRRAGQLTSTGVRDLRHRAQGVAARVRNRFHQGARDEVDDRVVADRVRAVLGRVTSRPRAIRVSAAAGRVCLTGAVLDSEQKQVLKAVRSVSGVRDVESRLELRDATAQGPEMQAGGHVTGPRSQFMQETWAAGPRLLALGGGTGLALYGLMRGRGNLPALVLGVLGAGLAMRAWRNESLGRTLRKATGQLPIDIQKAIHVVATPERLFDLWSDFEQFPRFMSMVQEVRRIDDTRSHWVVKGPAGALVEWTSVLVERQPGRLLAWHTEPGAPVEHAGSVRFEPTGHGTTVEVRMSYRPPGGALGHTVAAILGRDPAQEIEADLMRMKAFVETGRTPHDAAQSVHQYGGAMGTGGASLH